MFSCHLYKTAQFDYAIIKSKSHKTKNFYRIGKERFYETDLERPLLLHPGNSGGFRGL